MRDDGGIEAGLEAWLRDRGDDLVEVSVSRPASGLSSETVFLDVVRRGAGAQPSRDAMVVRMPPTTEPLFPDYSLERMARVQNALATTDVPVAAPVTFVEDERWIGTPFLVTPRVEGRVLASMPSYAEAGWLHDATNDDRTRLVDDVLATMARLHRLDWRALDLGPLSGGGPDLAEAVAWWRDYTAWATGVDLMPAEYTVALDWCAANLPEAPAATLLWGDAQLANAVFDSHDFRVVALLDWEMASYGPAETDLAWLVGLHEMTVSRVPEHRRASFPDHDELVARYEHHLGRPVGDLRWYEVFAAVRSGTIVTRLMALQAAPGTDLRWLRSMPQVDVIRALVDRVDS